ncbi:MAG: tetratricopeptide repeat protein [Aggregatilineales bacterium]
MVNIQQQLGEIDDLLRRREIKKAEVLIAKCLRQHLTPYERARTLLARGRVRLIGGRIDDALDDVEKARSLSVSEFNHPAALELLADIHFARFELASVGFADRGDTALALQLYERILADYPEYDNLGWVLYQKGRVLLTEGHIDEAVGCFEQALSGSSRIEALNAYCYERLGFVAYYEHRKLETALDYVDRAVHAYPVDQPRSWLVQVHTLRARILHKLGQHQGALDAIQTGLNVAASAGSEGRLGLADAAFAAAEIASEMPGYENDLIEYIRLFFQNSSKPLGLDVTWSRAYEMLGTAQMSIGQPAAALASFRSALGYNQYHPWELMIYFRMACCHYQCGSYEDAIATIGKILTLSEQEGQPISDYRVYNILGNAHFALEQYERACAAYEQALALLPRNDDAAEGIRRYHTFAQALSQSV